MEYLVERLTPEKLNVYWPFIGQEMSRVPHIWEKWWTQPYLWDAAHKGIVQCWSVGPPNRVHLVVFSQILYFPANVILQVFLALGNDLEACMPVLGASLEKFAIDNGCTLVQVVGRKGWGKVLEQYGFSGETVNLFAPIQTVRIQ